MRGFVFLLLLPLLAGCAKGDWEFLTSFGGSASKTEATAPPPVRESIAQPAPAPAGAQPATQAAPPNAFCVAVARQDAMGNGFDTATQARVAQRSYQQCLGIFGNLAEK